MTTFCAVQSLISVKFLNQHSIELQSLFKTWPKTARNELRVEAAFCSLNKSLAQQHGINRSFSDSREIVISADVSVFCAKSHGPFLMINCSKLGFLI